MTLILPIPNEPESRFVCIDCGHAKSMDQASEHHRSGKSGIVCKCCHEKKVVARNTAKYITKTGNKAWKSSKRSAQKSLQKKYKNGKLPKWMFS